MDFDHIGIIVTDIPKACIHLSQTLPIISETQTYDDILLTVSVKFLKDNSGIVYELISPLGEGSVVKQALRKGINIINQVAYRTENIEETSQKLVESGFRSLGEKKPAIAFNGAFVQFFMSPLGFVVELIGTKDYKHNFL